MRDHIYRAAMVICTGALVFIVVRASSSRLRLQQPLHDAESSIALGREVYISEGCINCHSQYVRPGAFDEVWWGPPADARQVLQEQPPLIGNRRQGPDLMNVGNRRSPAWNRIHLINPRVLSPGSRMPAYPHLFAAGDARGKALLAYLSDLGGDTGAERNVVRQLWKPEPDRVAIRHQAQAALFQENCRQCHGENGAGDGVLANQLGPRKPRDLTRGQWQFIPRRDAPAERRLELARVIKFGISGTSMPGHEYFADAKVLGLAEYVESLHSVEITK